MNPADIDLKPDFEYYKNLIYRKRVYIRYIKRALDLIVSPIIILIVSPILIITAIAIKLTSKGPIIFKQERVGYNTKKFMIYKFRSMYMDKNNSSQDHLNPKELTQKNILKKKKNDPRVTPVGKIIRKTSIDELPQLFNILKGDMSFVGPRPNLDFMLKPFPNINRIRSLVKPGLTGYWQVKNRVNNDAFIHMIKFDLYYLENISFLLDLKIILETFPSLIKAKGAY